MEECQSIIQCEREKETIAQQYQEEDNAEYKIQLLEAQEMERQRIARDLHDSTVQDLTSMLHKIELSMRVMDMDSQRCKMELSNVLDNIRNVISNTTHISFASAYFNAFVHASCIILNKDNATTGFT